MRGRLSVNAARKLDPKLEATGHRLDALSSSRLSNPPANLDFHFSTDVTDSLIS